MDIKKLKNKYKTDKFNIGYFDGLYEFLIPLHAEAKNVMEIGTKNGESVLLWRELMPSATIYAVDIKGCAELGNKDRVKHLVGNAYNIDFVKTLEDNLFDLIIDDGPHTIESFHFLIDHYISKLKSGGTLVIEDIINLKWTSELCNKLSRRDGIVYTVLHMGGKQKTERLLELWSKGLDVILIHKI